MRVTIDLDTKNPFKVTKTILKGMYYCRKIPSRFRFTTKGIHLIWDGMNISFAESIYYRAMIGDDLNRMLLDLSSEKRIKQVLFDEKTIFTQGFILASSCRSAGINPKGRDLTLCPKCNQPISYSMDYRTDEKNHIEVYHKNSDNICVIKRKKFSIINIFANT